MDSPVQGTTGSTDEGPNAPAPGGRAIEDMRRGMSTIAKARDTMAGECRCARGSVRPVTLRPAVNPRRTGCGPPLYSRREPFSPVSRLPPDQ